MCFGYGASACEIYHSWKRTKFMVIVYFLKFVGLVKFVERTVRMKHASSPNEPIYLVGDSFGGCLALAVAAHNPNIDLVLILSNPGKLAERESFLVVLLLACHCINDPLSNF